jgi:hypothetical protein
MLNVIVKDAREFFDARLCGLFLPDEVVVMPLPRNGRKIDPRTYIGNRSFLVRAASGYPDALINNPSHSYSTTSLGLTATVLRTLIPQVAANVDEDPRWSQELHPALAEAFRPCMGRRTWMGVPLLMRDSKQQCLFGVLTVTRGIESPRHANSFDDRDVAAAEDIAGLIALALYNRQITGSTRNKVLRWFLHGTTTPLVSIRDHYLPEIERAVGLGKRVSVARVKDLCSWANDATEFLLAGFHAYGILAGKQGQWRPEPSPFPVRDVVDTVCRIIDASDKSVAGVQEALITPPDLVCCCDRIKLMTILLVLIQNAINAVKSTERDDGKVSVEIVGHGDELVITVKDNGCGFTEEVEQRMFEEGFSRFPSEGASGLGLAIVRRFVVDLARGKIETWGKPNQGAKFIVCLPRGV